MKRRSWVILFALVVLGCAPSLIGKAAPGFALTDASGRVVSLTEFRGKSKVILVFYTLMGESPAVNSSGSCKHVLARSGRPEAKSLP